MIVPGLFDSQQDVALPPLRNTDWAQPELLTYTVSLR